MIELRRVETWVQDGNPASSERVEEPKRFMVGSVPSVEWYVEAAVAGRSLGSTTLALALNLAGFWCSFCTSPSSLGISAQAVGAKRPDVYDSQEQKSQSSAP